MDGFKSYFRTFISSYLSIIALAAGFNWFIDPLGMFNKIRIEGINRVKTETADSNLRRRKAGALYLNQYKVIFLGSSRVLVGLDPGMRPSIYNAGMGGMNFYEVHEIFNSVIENQNPAVIVVGLDFYAFSSRQKTSGDFDESYFSRRSKTSIMTRNLLSSRILLLSFKTILNNQRGVDPSYASDQGFKQMEKAYAGIPFPHLVYSGFSLQKLLAQKDFYAAYEYSPERVDLLEDMIDKARDRNIELYLFLSAPHAIWLESIRALGLWQDFETWKRDLTELAVRKNRERPDLKPVVIWDFNTYNSITTEAIPPLDLPEKRMKYYWDGSHFSREVGVMILKLIVTGDRGTTPPDFGRILDPQTIDEMLAEQNRLASEYRKANPYLMEWLDEKIRMTKRFRPAEGEISKTKKQNFLP